MSLPSIYNSNTKINDNQVVFDAFNTLMRSDDRTVFYKMATKINIFNMIAYLPGDIIECGVFKGSSLLLWLKLVAMTTPNSIRKVIGFDFFDQNFVEDLEDATDKKAMAEVFSRCPVSRDDISVEGITSRLVEANFSQSKFELVKGDLSVTSKEYVDSRPGMRIALLYMDVDLEKPTYDALCVMWDRIVPGGIVVFDEYGYHIWSESNAVDQFVKEKELTLHLLDIPSPTAYIIKN
ncbi:MAG: macrocin O-methyltransferase [Candidatus Colwellbacteria bacterium]|nr:macrocin O-methyltransferase [Candidatus Colwellbacteria bacterium]